MRSEHWQCKSCGDTVDVPRGRHPTTVLLTTARGRTRILLVDMEEIHRCHPDATDDTNG
jgi:hypothetical protein